LVVRKAGFITMALEGQQLIELSLDKPQRNVVIALRKTGRLTGRVLLSDGRPAVAAVVEAWCYSGNSEPNLARTAATDDRGEFRLIDIVAATCSVEARTQWQGGSKALAATKAPTRDRMTKYPGDERSIINTVNVIPGESATVGDLIVEIENSHSSPSTQTGALHGYLVDLRTNAPIFPGIVSAEADNSRVVRTAATDFVGRFVLDVPAGTYRVWASGPAYVTDMTNATSVRVAEEVTGREGSRRDIIVRLRRAGVIEGRLYWENGEPLQGGVIHLYRDRYVLGEKRLVMEPQRTATDDRGVFRFFGLRPGSYYASASLAEDQNVGTSETRPLFAPDEIAPTFYPTGSAVAAAAIPVDSESTISDITLTWSPSNTGALAVQVFDDKGAVAPDVTIDVGPTLASRLPMALGFHAKTDVNGNARLSGLPNGEYYIHVYGQNATFGYGVAQVFGDGATVVRVRLGRGAEVRGRLIDSATSLQPAHATAFLIRAVPTSFDNVPTTASAPRAQPQSSGEFVLHNMWGSASIWITGPDGFYLRRVLADGVDATDAAIRFDSPFTPHLITVEVGREHTDLSGSVIKASDGKPAQKCTVVAFETDPNRLGPWSRFVAAIPCEPDSSFHYSKLPSGQYFVFAVASMENGELDDREWLDAHRRQAKTVRLVDGAQEVVALKLVE